MESRVALRNSFGSYSGFYIWEFPKIGEPNIVP